MANPTFVKGGTTLTFKPGTCQAKRIPDRPRQRKLVSSDGTVRVLEISSVDDRFINLQFVEIPSADSGSFSGRNNLRTFIVTTVNWSELTFTFTDADSDSFTVRWWDEEFDLAEAVKDQWNGRMTLRIEV